MVKPSVAIISPQPLLRHALACLLSVTKQYGTVEEYGDWNEIIQVQRELRDYLCFIDAELPDKHIAEIMTLLGNNTNKFIIFGCLSNKDRVVELVTLRADGYISMDLSETDFFRVLNKVSSSTGTVISDNLVSELVDRLAVISDSNINNSQGYIELTPRENEILKLLASGFTNNDIAKRLVISVYTVKNHVHNIFDKVGVANRAQLVAFALTKGLVSGETLS